MLKTRTEILNFLVSEKEYEQIIRKYIPTDKQKRDELRQIVFLAIAELDEKKLIHLFNSGQIKFWFIKIIHHQVISAKSPFYKHFLIHNNGEYEQMDLIDSDCPESLLIEKEEQEEEQRKVYFKMDIYYGIKRKIIKENPKSIFIFELYEKKYMYGEKYETIAGRINRPLSTVYKQIQKLKKKIDQMVSELN